MFTEDQILAIRKAIEFFLDGRNIITNEATRTVNQFKVEGCVKRSLTTYISMQIFLIS